MGPDMNKDSRSRWVNGSSVPRYDERSLDYILSRYREAPEWHRGAKVVKRSKP